MDNKKIKAEDLEKVSGGRIDDYYSMRTYDDWGVKDLGPGQVGSNHPLITYFVDACRGWKKEHCGGLRTCLNCIYSCVPPMGRGINFCRKRSQEHDPNKW